MVVNERGNKELNSQVYTVYRILDINLHNCKTVKFDQFQPETINVESCSVTCDCFSSLPVQGG